MVSLCVPVAPFSVQVEAVLLPVSVPVPFNVSMFENPPDRFAATAKVPEAPFAVEAPSVGLTISVPASVSLPEVPFTEPVSAALILNISLPNPPFRSAVVATVTLNVSANVPPCNVAKPRKSKALLPTVTVLSPDALPASAHVLIES